MHGYKVSPIHMPERLVYANSVAVFLMVNPNVGCIDMNSYMLHRIE